MKQARKSVSVFGFVEEAEAFVRTTFYENPKAWLIAAREKVRDLPKTNFDLGCYFADMGKWRDAIFRFKVTLHFAPDYPQALYNLGYCQYQLGHYEKAAETLKRVLAKNPTHQDAAFMLSALEPEALSPSQRPQQMPRQMLIDFFTGLAADYNQAEAHNQYRGGIVVAEQVKPLLPAVALTIIDFGCGSGIAAIPYRPMAGQIIGIDLTPALVEQAQSEAFADKKLFDKVYEADISQLGGSLSADIADLVLLVNTAQYVGSLNNVMMSAARSLKQGGLMALTIEPFTSMEGFGIVAKSGRFGHSIAYVKQAAAPAGLTFVKSSEVSLYPDTAATLVILRKGQL